jgi:antitoxin (DNA-binding transcriptional repressor) of toxin-antitoxin stability system
VIQIDTQEETDMRSINVRDLRLRSAQVWRQLAEEKELVVRSKGKSVAVLSATTEDMLETTLTALRRARALQAVMALQMESARVGKDRLTLDDINKEIGAVRQSRQP